MSSYRSTSTWGSCRCTGTDRRHEPGQSMTKNWSILSTVVTQVLYLFFPGSVSHPALNHANTDLHRAPRTHPGSYCYHKTRSALPFSLIFIQLLFKSSGVRNITGSLHYLCKSSCIHRNGVPSEYLSWISHCYYLNSDSNGILDQRNVLLALVWITLRWHSSFCFPVTANFLW